VDELHRNPQSISGTNERADDDAIHVGLRRERFQIGCFVREARGDRTRSHDKRVERRQRTGDRVSQTECQKVGFSVGPQHAKRQNDDTGQRVREDRSVTGAHTTDRAKLAGHFVGRRRPVRWRLGHRASNYAIHGGDGRRPGERRRLLVTGRVNDLGERPACKGGPPGEHLEDDGAGGKQIAARIDRFASHLLWRHVAGRAHHDTGSSHIRYAGVRSVDLRARQAEVEQLHAVRREKHVRGLQIAMNDRLRMERGESSEDTEGDRKGVRRAHRAVAQTVRQHFPFEQLHGDEQLTAVLADFVDLTDVGMVDAGGGARFAPEALACGLVAPDGRHCLERHRPLEALVARSVDDAHPAFAQLARDRIMADASWHEPTAGLVVAGARILRRVLYHRPRS